MQVFIMHVGHPGNVDIPYTVTRRRNISEILATLKPNAPERKWFEKDPQFHAAFPDGAFHCWGIPRRAEPRFRETQIGDLVLIIPTIGVHNGGIHQLGIVETKCPVECYEASHILWPRTPNARPFPYVFFFHTEAGYRGWVDFLDDMAISANWNPKGYYRRLTPRRFMKWGGPEGYLHFLRGDCGFKPI